MTRRPDSRWLTNQKWIWPCALVAGGLLLISHYLFGWPR